MYCSQCCLALSLALKPISRRAGCLKMVQWDQLGYLRRAAVNFEGAAEFLYKVIPQFVDLRLCHPAQGIDTCMKIVNRKSYTTFERTGTEQVSSVLESVAEISLGWFWEYKSLTLHLGVSSISPGLVLLDWAGDVLSLLTGTQSCKLGVTGEWGTECSCWWLGRAFLSLAAERGIYMSCCIHFYPLSLWQIYHALIFLAEICQFFMVVKRSWKDPWKPLPILKVSEF